MAGLSTPQILVNNEVIGIKPNSFEYDEGFGERNVRTKSAGGASRQIVVTRNVETEKSTVKFVLFTEDSSISVVRQWLNNIDANVIQASDSGFNRTFNQAIITGNPTNGLGVDGEIPLEWESQPAV